MSAESHAELQRWFDANKATEECRLAMKHRTAMPAEVAQSWKDQAPGDSDSEKELGLVFALTQIAEQLDTVQLLMSNLQVVAPGVKVPASHVDVTPLEP